MGKWLAGILASVITSVLIFWLTDGFPRWGKTSAGDSPSPSEVSHVQAGQLVDAYDRLNSLLDKETSYFLASFTHQVRWKISATHGQSLCEFRLLETYGGDNYR